MLRKYLGTGYMKDGNYYIVINQIVKERATYSMHMRKKCIQNVNWKT
jgi:hypothetical protein